ncbi:hypothetical protein BDY19DRAFT_908154 [Irpex rosettiformis]|uniref:Uncharacterized protein n=1 Tax=Irpex rosettiformis TaxID=378272 RepID=A0ACB8TXC0_9APHY|nr:hypothetical protein BDY19DRAFT_908154 [Irpex rosettiformis]
MVFMISVRDLEEMGQSYLWHHPTDNAKFELVVEAIIMDRDVLEHEGLRSEPPDPSATEGRTSKRRRTGVGGVGLTMDDEGRGIKRVGHGLTDSDFICQKLATPKGLPRGNIWSFASGSSLRGDGHRVSSDSRPNPTQMVNVQPRLNVGSGG